MSEQICQRSGKVQYTNAGAKRALGALRDRRGPSASKPEARSYKCRDCGMYHLTSKHSWNYKPRPVRGAFGDF